MIAKERPSQAQTPLSTVGEKTKAKRRPRRIHIDVGTGAAIVVAAVIVLVAVFGPLITPHEPDAQNLRMRLVPPVWDAGGTTEHILGTDTLGRDVLSRLLVGAQVSLSISGVATLLALVVGSVLGLFAGYRGGWTDTILMRVADAQLAFPPLLLAIAVAAILQPSTTLLIGVLFIRSWVVYARFLRASVMSLKHAEFVDATIVAGASSSRILFRHIAPNTFSVVIVICTLQLAELIIIESSLSFLGLGVQPPTPTWGSMLSEGRDYMASSWWLATFPGVAIALTVLSANLIGDLLRDWLDPRTQHS